MRNPHFVGQGLTQAVALAVSAFFVACGPIDEAEAPGPSETQQQPAVAVCDDITTRDYNNQGTLYQLDTISYAATGPGVQPTSPTGSQSEEERLQAFAAAQTCACPTVQINCTNLPAGTGGMCQGCAIYMPTSAATTLGFTCGGIYQNPQLANYPLLQSGTQATVYCTLRHEGAHACVANQPISPSCNEAQAFQTGQQCMQAYYNANCATNPPAFGDCATLAANLSLQNAGQYFNQCKCNGNNATTCYNACLQYYPQANCAQIYNMYANF